ncbi:YheC/YheD family protein [Paenibacillus sp. JX-17]|uniref:YheC/YheD family protein n=1 Tax=Paenibacillus lacisoli TaxID=3064525 RepID=A0ABT9CA80_9BACL|nr:YheC/YheD family protein [Paenibacillus sp. JX-17]MDO7906151.1 YheC/YheD family protein [Paenibacillus sp. JX-17]
MILPIQRVSSKWAKTQVMMANKRLSMFIPATQLYSRQALEELLLLHKTVYIKPDRGTYGNGVMNVSRDGDTPDTTGIYILRHGLTSKSCSSLDEVHTAITSKIKNRTFIAQQGISMLQYQGRPFDLRVLTQFSPQRHWETTGIIGRVAAAGKIITNYHGGGQVQTLRTLLKSYMTDWENGRMELWLNELGRDTARQLQKAYPRLKEIGLDIAIDEHYQTWILEVNTLPGIFGFNWLPDKRIYQRIQRYAAAYGRFSKAKR